MNAVASHNVKFISHSDQGGRGDGVQIMVHRGYAYIGHGYSNGTVAGCCQQIIGLSRASLISRCLRCGPAMIGVAKSWRWSPGG